MIPPEMFEEARTNLRGIAKVTDLMQSKTFSTMAGCPVHLKLENLQITGSFKIRGAYNRISRLDEADRGKGVVCSSAGNHAQGVALAATRLGIESRIFMPRFSAPSKINATRSYGGQVHLTGSSYDDAYQAAIEHARSQGMPFIHAFDDDLVIAGQGTIGLEILDALPEIGTVLVPVGGGGLISGIASVLKYADPSIRVIGVEAEGAQAMLKSLERKRVTPYRRMETIADGIAVKTPGKRTFEIVRRTVDRIVVVDDNEIAGAMYLLLQRSKLLVEPAGAVSLAALLSGKVNGDGRNTVVLLSGGNANLSLLTQVMEQGMFRENVLARVSITVPDRARTLRDVLTILANLQANVQDISHDRTAPSLMVGYVRITITFQIVNKDKIDELKRELERRKLSYEIDPYH